MHYNFKFWKIVFLLLLMTCLFSFGARKEYELKAAYLCQFLKYIEFNDKSEFFHIGVIGENPFNGFLKKYDGKSLNKRKIKIHYLGKDKAKITAQKCHIYFFAKSEVLKQKDILKLVNAQSLTVGDNKWFNQSGGMLNLLLKPNGSVRWEINKTEISKLKVSSKIIRMAENKNE